MIAVHEDCIRCGEAPACDGEGLCGHCHWAVRTEEADFWAKLGEYLECWARFTEWCEQNEARTT